MPYTLLRVTEAGVVLRDFHLRRLGLEQDGPDREDFLRFAAEAKPGVFAVWTEPSGLRVEERGGSRLWDGMAARLLRSPVLDHRGPLPKPRSPSAYDGVRIAGTATLLTSADGKQLLEACSAAVVGWDGQRIVCVPSDRPRVESTSEAAIRAHLPVREAPLSPLSSALLLVNAVKGTCAIGGAQSESFPAPQRRQLDELFAQLTRR